MMKKIAMFGGTFNPIHNGHIKLALYAAAQLELDKVLLIPTNIPPHKRYEEETTPRQRWEMCVLAAEEYQKLQVSDLEIRRQGPSYTVDTLRQLRARIPDAQLYLITGADMFLTIQDWKNAQEIFRLAVVCGVPREKEGLQALQRQADFLKNQYSAQTALLDFPLIEISSTQIRHRLKTGRSIEEWVPKNVERYIRRHGLYGDTQDEKSSFHKL